MAVHQETLGEDVGGKLLLLASLLAVFGIIALILMPLGAAFAPPSAPPAATATATPAGDATPATDSTTATPPVAVEGDSAPPGAAPAGLPPIVGALMPGIVMLVAAAILAALAGLFLGYAKARAEEADAARPETPH